MIWVMLEQAEQADSKADDDGQTLPREIDRRQKLRVKMQEARVELEQQARRKADSLRPTYEAKQQPPMTDHWATGEDLISRVPTHTWPLMSRAHYKMRERRLAGHFYEGLP